MGNITVSLNIMTPKQLLDFTTQLITPEELAPKSINEVIELPTFLNKLEACETQLRQPFSDTDHYIQNALVFRRLQQLINILLLNPVWKERINQAGLVTAPTDFEQWQQLPISDKAAINDMFSGDRPGMVVPIQHGGFEIVASGGTSSGKPSETVYSIKELHDTYKLAGRYMGRYMLPTYLDGLEPKWVYTTLADYQMWSSGTMVGGVLQNIPGINYIGAGPVMKDVFHQMMSYPGPKAIMGITQGIAILADLGFDMPAESRNSLWVAMYGSGVLSQLKQSELKGVYPNLTILSYFAATQAETIGLQLKPEGYLTAVPGLHLIEIVDEQGRWVDEGEEGELVVTRLHANEAPVLRFKLGDRMIRRPNIDGPGLRTHQFEYAGRSGDVIHLCDTQYTAKQAYTSLCLELKKSGVFDLDALVHEIQFINDRTSSLLTLMASVDNVGDMTLRMEQVLGPDGIHQLFAQAIANSLSIFNQGEANTQALEKYDYRFQIKLVPRFSPEIFRSELGKVPLLRDIF